ncbi:cupin domain-containing protein [Coraliomargarita akajimensis]|nr:cupin domain-containing protein [Coraliomargarita akajimensis]
MNQHTRMIQNNGISAFEQADMPEFSAADFDGWEGLSLEAAGVFFFMFKVAPDAADFPLHAAPDEYLGYVVKGGGTLYAGSAEAKTDSIEFSEGDFITFKPDTQHAWTNGDSETKILFVRAL